MATYPVGLPTGSVTVAIHELLADTLTDGDDLPDAGDVTLTVEFLPTVKAIRFGGKIYRLRGLTWTGTSVLTAPDGTGGFVLPSTDTPASDGATGWFWQARLSIVAGGAATQLTSEPFRLASGAAIDLATATTGSGTPLLPLEVQSWDVGALVVPGASLPDQTSQGGKVLGTDGATASWQSPSGAVASVAGRTGAVTLTSADVGLGNVNNTSDAAKPISTATQTALDGKVAAAGLTEAVQDIVGTMTVAGAGISVTYDDAAGSLTVTNTGSGATPRAPHVVVASADAPATLKAIADYVCDGTADQVEINAAITAAAVLQSRNALMPAGAQQIGKVYLTGGRFSCSASIQIRTGVHLQGSGWGTELRAVGVTEAGLIRNADPNDHAFLISDMYLYGNWSSGGTCSGIDIDSTGSVNSGGVGNYPSTAPDNYYALQRLFIDGFTGGANSANRHGVYSHGGGYHRGPMALDLQIRNIGGNGIYWSSASDGFIANCHIGTVGGSGLRIATGNTKIANCKTFYCDTWGLYVTSGRGTLSGFESQDDASGVFLDGAPWTLAAVTIDTWSATALRMSSDGIQVSGVSVFNRAGGRYATSGTAILWDAGSDACILSGVVDPTNVTTVISGTPGLYCRGEVITQGVGVTTIST